MQDVDVVIIGAGSAGLSAARILQAAGVFFT
ncbi:FAD-dependent monooxygenase, partial [Mesorhizobium sp. M7A.F.Ca.CA.004.04.1.1]